MIRSLLVIVVTLILTIVLGTILITVGLLIPARWCFNPIFHFWGWGILKAAGVRLIVTGDEQVQPGTPCFFVGNHQSALDIPAMATVTRGRVRFMAKKSLFYIPFMGWAIWMHGFVPVDRSNPRTMKRVLDGMLKRLARNAVSMLVFPEGTRSEDGSVGEFRRGTLRVCRQAGMPIVPFSIDGSLAVHRRGALRIHSGPIRVCLGRPISKEEISGLEVPALSKSVRDRVLGLMHDDRDSEATAINHHGAQAPCGGAS
jgi:1-acyl-sn-glycerol-3-phosphate acyltransferase